MRTFQVYAPALLPIALVSAFRGQCSRAGIPRHRQGTGPRLEPGRAARRHGHGAQPGDRRARQHVTNNADGNYTFRSFAPASTR